MTPLIRYWLDLCLLRAAPQDGPASTYILGVAISCYAMISVLVLTGSYGMLTGAQLALTELVLLITFVAVLLYLKGRTARIRQTLSAMTGAGSVLGLVALPLVLLFRPVPDNDSLPIILSLIWLSLLLWNLVVSAHIMRHALSTHIAVGFALSLFYMLFSAQLVVMLFPQQAGFGQAG